MADSTLEKLLDDNKVKAASWTHNTSINKLGYFPLQLATGKAIMIPALTRGNMVIESMKDER